MNEYGEYDIDDFEHDLNEVEADLNMFQRFKKKINLFRNNIPYASLEDFMMAFKPLLRSLEYPHYRTINKENQKVIIGTNPDGETDVFWFTEKKTKLAENDLKQIQRLANRYNVVVNVCFAGYWEDLSEELYAQRDEYNFEITTYSDLLEDVTELEAIYDEIISVQHEVVIALQKKICEMLLKEEPVERRIVN